MRSDSSERLLECTHSDTKDQEVRLEYPNESQRSTQRNIAFILTLISFVIIVVVATGLTAKVFAMEASTAESSVVLRTSKPEAVAMTKAPPNFTYCGPDVETALAQDCRLDHMGGWWLPRQCYDSELLLAMDGGRNGDHNRSLPTRFGIEKFSWYRDENKSLPLRTLKDLESHLVGQARSGEKMTAVTNIEHHAAHCAYTSTVVGQTVIKMQNGGHNIWIPEPLTRKEHPEHCEVLFGSPFLGRKGGGLGEMYTKIGFEFSGCSRLTM